MSSSCTRTVCTPAAAQTTYYRNGGIWCCVFFGDKSYYSTHRPDAPGMYDHKPIRTATGGHLKDGDLYRPKGTLRANLAA